ncbi:MAG: hypothetical protein EOP51_04965 [Sphingobacteriales bacterium]|nr:MAG: hypothetical protein EOP51_04965 [Sphingobacteriales bacterium]
MCKALILKARIKRYLKIKDNKKKTYNSANAAALAAKQDMMDASATVAFSVSKEQLRTAIPMSPIMKQTIEWDNLLRADSNMTPEALKSKDNVTIVPLGSDNSVVTVISLMQEGDQYAIGGLGDKQLSTELDLVKKVEPNGAIQIYEVPNLNAVIYSVASDGAARYYTSYNNNSLRQPQDAKTLVANLRADAARFQKMYGDQLKKGKLVK